MNTVVIEVCPGEGSDRSHHFVPRPIGRRGGEPVQVQVCRYCNKTLNELRREANNKEKEA